MTQKNTQQKHHQKCFIVDEISPIKCEMMKNEVVQCCVVVAKTCESINTQNKNTQNNTAVVGA